MNLINWIGQYRGTFQNDLYLAMRTIPIDVFNLKALFIQIRERDLPAMSTIVMGMSTQCLNPHLNITGDKMGDYYIYI